MIVIGLSDVYGCRVASCYDFAGSFDSRLYAQIANEVIDCSQWQHTHSRLRMRQYSAHGAQGTVAATDDNRLHPFTQLGVDHFHQFGGIFQCAGVLQNNPVGLKTIMRFIKGFLSCARLGIDDKESRSLFCSYIYCCADFGF